VISPGREGLRVIGRKERGKKPEKQSFNSEIFSPGRQKKSPGSKEGEGEGEVKRRPKM